MNSDTSRDKLPVFMRISPYKTIHLRMVPRKTRFQEFWMLTIKSMKIKFIKKR